MKKFLVLIFVFSVLILSAQNIQPTIKNELPMESSTHRVFENVERDAPEYEFITDPSTIITSYYDYMPGSYNSYPLRVQGDGEGYYVTFHGKETAASTRRIYYAYIDGDGNIMNVATIGSEDIYEGYCGIDIDPITNDPITAWHQNYTGAIAHKDVCSYDLYHLGSSGLWKTPFTIIDETIPTPFADDDFIWPYVYIGPSPDADKRRVYVVCNNYISHQPSGNPSENVLIGHADFNEGDFNVQSELSWSWTTIPMLDDWNQGIPEETRPNQSFAVSDDGQVCWIGYSSAPEGSTTGNQLYVLYNDNYGEGDYEFVGVPAEWDIPNPQNQDGTYRFVDENGAPHELYMSPYLCNHMTPVFADGESKVMFLGNMNMMLHPASWFPDLPMMYLKLYTYDIATQEFSFMDFVDVPGANPNDENPMLPWDLNEDGDVDEYDDDGYVTWVDGHPIYFNVTDDMFHENATRLTKNEENGWMAAVWVDGLKCRLAIDGVAGYTGWEEKVEIKISLSGDDGVNWSDPITMNAKNDDGNYVAELDGMMPCYLYPSDKIIDLGDNHGQLDFFFYDDNSFGSFSSPSGHGQNLGGELMYMSLDLDFSELVTSSHNNVVAPAPATLHQNYPNPFNPNTTIKYSLQQEEHIQINVYNVKGQKVVTLVDEVKSAGTHLVEWNGKDANQKSVTSGVYFSQMGLNNRDYTSIKKMILLK
jgi:Secretion system C-terminal sorting domain